MRQQQTEENKMLGTADAIQTCDVNAASSMNHFVITRSQWVSLLRRLYRDSLPPNDSAL